MTDNTEMRLVFMGTLFPAEQEEQILSKLKIKPSSAPNILQWNLIHGLEEVLGRNIEIINGLPVGTWPNYYSDWNLPTRRWMNGTAESHELGCINLPFLKQAMRASKAKRLLKRFLRPGDKVILYGAYMPFLKALRKLPRNIDITAIITDLPEYYDLDQVSSVRAFLRKMQNKLIYKYMERVDSFVLLTEQMAEAVHAGSRPWMLMEGICNQSAVSTVSGRTGKAILYSGTLYYQFGIKNLLEAFQKLEDTDAELWICGSGEAEQEIKRLCETDPRIRFFGFLSQQEVAELRSRAAVLVNPRTNEGEYTKYSFPSKTMEYMASGKPVVMYRLDGVPKDYAPYLYYVEDNTPDALKNTLSYVLEHPQEAAEKGKMAQKFVLEKKNPKTQGQRLVDFLQSKRNN